MLCFRTSKQRWVNEIQSQLIHDQFADFWWTGKNFVFSISASRIDNSRVKSLEFDVKTSFTMHGFAGYFETVLYGDIMLSKSSVNNNVYLNMALKRDFCAWSYLLLGASSIISMQHAQPFSPIRASLCFLLIQLSAVLASGCRFFTFSVKKIKFSLRYVLFHLAHFYR